MDLLLNDVLKFRRSKIWAVIAIVPLIAVAIGAANYTGNSEQLSEDWQSYFSQITLFYGLLFMTAGIAIIASAAWRFEHRGHNWHTMLTSTRSAGALIASKIAAISVATAAMQLALLATALVGGWVLGLPGAPPAELIGAALLALVPAASVAAWQSFFSMIIRNFAGPVAIGVLSSIVSFGVMASGATFARFVLPPALLSDTLWLGSTSVGYANALNANTVFEVIVVSCLSCVAGWLASTLYLRRADIRL